MKSESGFEKCRVSKAAKWLASDWLKKMTSCFSFIANQQENRCRTETERNLLLIMVGGPIKAT